MQNQEYKEALVELLYQLADDDFILSFRGSEWLGLAPHIEEDLAYASINQNTMGHAYLYYKLLEELGEGTVDELAHGRKASKRRNAIILEEANGTGTYLSQPKFDWAFTVVRHYFYDLYKKIKLDSLKNSTYEPLAQAALNISKEEYYHLMHWGTWFKQLILAGGEAKTRMLQAVTKVWEDFDGVLSYGTIGKKIEENELIETEAVLRERLIQRINGIFASLGLEKMDKPEMKRGNGRDGVHTEDLNQAIATFSEVYTEHPAAIW